MSVGAAPARRPRGPGVTYTAVSLVLLVVVASLTLSARQPPPPTISEFAPQAVEQITEAPSEQASRLGAGRDPGADQDTATAEVEARLRRMREAIDVPRVRRCVGDPPRQIEDPQSPPCVPYWSGDNGGVTTRGVTGNEIRVAYGRGGSEELSRTEKAILAFFNSRFELYGRRIRLLPFSPQAQSVATMQGDAVQVDEQMKPFAAMAYSFFGVDSRSSEYYDELARRKIVSVQTVQGGALREGENHFRSFAPYQWNYLPSIDFVLANYGQFICRALARRPPKYAGVPQNGADQRKFGLVLETFSDGSPPVDIAPLQGRLSRCDTELVVEHSARESTRAEHTTVIIGLREAGVTSLMCICLGGHLTSLMNSASATTYYPEWLISNYGEQDRDSIASGFPSDQASHVFGLMSWDKSLPRHDMVDWWAIKEADPEYDGSDDPWGCCHDFQVTYANLLVLASGIQLAGPRLTPEAFQTGLQRARFPNPGCGAPARYQACVGFEGNTHTMVKDLVPVWWNPAARSVQYRTARGAYCYADLGTRFGMQTWPDDIELFQLPCR